LFSYVAENKLVVVVVVTNYLEQQVIDTAILLWSVVTSADSGCQCKRWTFWKHLV